MQVDYDKGLTLETVVLIKDSSQWPIWIINSVDKTRLSCYTLTVLAQSLFVVNPALVLFVVRCVHRSDYVSQIPSDFSSVF